MINSWLISSIPLSHFHWLLLDYCEGNPGHIIFVNIFICPFRSKNIITVLSQYLNSLQFFTIKYSVHKFPDCLLNGILHSVCLDRGLNVHTLHLVEMSLKFPFFISFFFLFYFFLKNGMIWFFFIAMLVAFHDHYLNLLFPCLQKGDILSFLLHFKDLFEKERVSATGAGEQDGGRGPGRGTGRRRKREANYLLSSESDLDLYIPGPWDHDLKPKPRVSRSTDWAIKAPHSFFILLTGALL